MGESHMLSSLISWAFTMLCRLGFPFVSGKELRFRPLICVNALSSKFLCCPWALMSLVAQKTLLCVPTQMRRVCIHSKTFLTYCGPWRHVTSRECRLVERGSRHAFLFFWAHYPVKLDAIYPIFQWACHTRLHVSCTSRSRDTFGSSTDQDYRNILKWYSSRMSHHISVTHSVRNKTNRQSWSRAYKSHWAVRQSNTRNW